eukprot:scaffold107194_cov46-Cyclotella_meneghiniana.AAC.1
MTVELHFFRLDRNNKEKESADRRAKEVVKQNSNESKSLTKFAADIVGNGDNGIVGPFESAQKSFIGGQVIPLVAGPFGEVNKEFEKVLKTLALLWPLAKTGCRFLHWATLIEREELLF